MGRWIRRILVGVVGFVVLLALAAGGVYTFTQYRLTRKHGLATPPIRVVSDSMSIAHGQHQATVIGKCVICHGQDFGGGTVVDDPGLGQIVATNLTTGTGGVLKNYTDSLLNRAIRYGIGADGRALVLMPSLDFHYFSDDDAGALIAYIRSLPPVNRDPGRTNIKMLGRVLYTAGKFPLFSLDEMKGLPAPPAHTPKGTPEAFGAYLANTGGCTGCHGPGLSGGPIPGVPPDWKPASNITPAGIGSWSEADFNKAIREGIRPNGTPIDTLMPWKLARGMTGEEFHALWTYLKTVPAKPYGNH